MAGRRQGSTGAWLGVGMVALQATALWWRTSATFGGENPLGAAPDGDNWHHEGLTRRAARSAGWSRRARNALAFHADYLDSYLYNPLWWFNVAQGGGLDRMRVVLSSRDDLVKLHFDDLFAPEQVRATWQRYMSGTVAGLLWIGTSRFDRRTKVSMAHNVVGASLHALQDFYSHSNWIDDAARRSTTWFELEEAARARLPLWTGSYEEPDHLGHQPHGAFLFACTLLNNLGSFGRGLMRIACHAASPLAGGALCQAVKACADAEAIEVPEAWKGAVPDALEDDLVWVKPGINVDSRWLADIGARERGVPGLDGETAFSTAYGLANRTSCQWLHVLEQTMDRAGLGDFWDLVKTTGVGDAEYVTDTAPWEDMAQLPYRFLSAGAYPTPTDGADEDAWFLRVSITTADVQYAGTDADIVAIVDGAEQPVLDHAPRPEPREPGDAPQRTVFDSVFSHDDFERGETAAYILGPFGSRPSSLVLRNDAPDAGDVVLAALEAVVDAVVDFFEAVGDFFLGLIGYHADFVDSAHHVFDAGTLNALGVGRRRTFTVSCDGGSEGRYRINGHVQKTSVTGVDGAVPWREYQVHTDRLHCLEESDWDRFSSSDEPFVLGLAIPHGGNDSMDRWRRGPYGDVDSGESRPIGVTTRVRVPETFGSITVAYAVYESDDESSSDRQLLLDEFAGGAEDALAEVEDDFLVTLGQSLAAGWRPSRIEAAAFRRGRTVELVRFGTVGVSRWVEGGDRLPVPLRVMSTTRVTLDLDVEGACQDVRIDPELIDLPDLVHHVPDIVDLRRGGPRFELELSDALVDAIAEGGEPDENGILEVEGVELVVSDGTFVMPPEIAFPVTDDDEDDDEAEDDEDDEDGGTIVLSPEVLERIRRVRERGSGRFPGVVIPPDWPPIGPLGGGPGRPPGR